MNGTVDQKQQDSSMSQDWQSNKFTTLERAKHLLETGLHADCEFLVGDGNDGTEKQLIKAHRIFLAMSSPVFETMFFGEMSQSAFSQHNSSSQNEAISLPDLTPSSFKDLLQYIYTDSLSLQSMDQAMGLCYAAKKYILPDLVNKCLIYVQHNLCPEYTCRVLEFIKLFDDEKLQAKCLMLLREQTKYVLIHPDFEELSESTLLSIVREEALNTSELELFDAVKRWAGRQCTQRGLEANGTNMREVLNKIIYEIRFLAMTSEEFASSPVLSGILTEKECMAIFMKLNNQDNWEMPGDLSSSRKQRRPSTTDGSSSNGLGKTTNKDVYCLRRVDNEARFLIEPSVQSVVTTLTVNEDVFIKGVVIAEIVLANSQQILEAQSMVLDCHLSDSYGRTVTSARVSKPLIHRSISLDPYFDRPVKLKRHREYRITVAVNRRAYFILGMASPVVSCQGIEFRFSTNESRDGLVRGVVLHDRSGRKLKTTAAVVPCLYYDDSSDDYYID